jgi:hypothetical protein
MGLSILFAAPLSARCGLGDIVSSFASFRCLTGMLNRLDMEIRGPMSFACRTGRGPEILSCGKQVLTEFMMLFSRDSTWYVAVASITLVRWCQR